VKKVKKARRSGRTRLSRKHQATIPVDALRRAGLQPGDELQVEATGAGRITLRRARDVISQYAGCLSGLYPPGYLARLRREWR
jgi:AbrB family looped-hinge helix DNA binding protein